MRDVSNPQQDAVAHLPPPPHDLEVTFGLLAAEGAPDWARLSASYAHKQRLKAAAASAAQVPAPSGAFRHCHSTECCAGVAEVHCVLYTVMSSFRRFVVRAVSHRR